jgi:AcrR family transcriptional regulator
MKSMNDALSNATDESSVVGVPTSERILSTSAALFREKGYAASTTRELAELLGIRKASLYHHIDTKEEILYQICVASLTRIIEEISKSIPAVESKDDLRRMIRSHVAEVVGTRDFHAVMLTEMRGLTPEHLVEVVALRDSYEKLIRDVVSQSQELGILRDDVSAKYLMLCLLNLLNWTIFWFKPGGDLDAEELGDLFASVFLEGASQMSILGPAATP